MRTDKEDTDPSSPSALRPSSGSGMVAAAARAVAGATTDAAHVQSSGVVAAAARARSGVVEAAAHAELDSPSPPPPTTDPGLGPASAPPPVSARRPMGVTVPAPSIRPAPGPSAITPPDLTPIAAPVSAAPSVNKDSVELLLEGMAGPRPDRRKTMPQSDGEASAAYHAEHGVRRARTSEPAGPKVVVERLAPAARSRSPFPGFAPGSSPGSAREPAGSREALSTFVPARVLRRRVAMAIVAGVLFVLLSFMGLRLSGRQEAPAPVPSVEATASPAETTAATQTVPTVTPPARPIGEAPGFGPVLPIPTTRSFEPPHAEEPPPSSAHAQGGASPTRHHRNAADAPASSGSDLGEFKTKF
jgi:hypothetical protein